MHLQNKTAVITGAAGGIGSALAERLASEGCGLILAGRDSATLEQLHRRLSTLSPSSHQHHQVVVLDVNNTGDIDNLYRVCQQRPGGIHILVNNAGLGSFALFEQESAASIDLLLRTNLIAPLIVTNRLLPLLRACGRAAIVNVGSVFGAIGHPGFAVYCASKAGLARFSEALRRETGESVSVIHISPRATATGMNSTAVNLLNRELGNRVDPPERVAQEIIFRLQGEFNGEANLGWPEKLYARLNALFPGIVSATMKKKLPTVRRLATSAVSGSGEPDHSIASQTVTREGSS